MTKMFRPTYTHEEWDHLLRQIGQVDKNLVTNLLSEERFELLNMNNRAYTISNPFGGQDEETTVSVAFFADHNINTIQVRIQHEFQRQTGYLIPLPNVGYLHSSMHDVYLLYSPFPTTYTIDQLISRLNNIVIRRGVSEAVQVCYSHLLSIVNSYRAKETWIIQPIDSRLPLCESKEQTETKPLHWPFDVRHGRYTHEQDRSQPDWQPHAVNLPPLLPGQRFPLNYYQSSGLHDHTVSMGN